MAQLFKVASWNRCLSFAHQFALRFTNTFSLPCHIYCHEPAFTSSSSCSCSANNRSQLCGLNCLASTPPMHYIDLTKR